MHLSHLQKLTSLLFFVCVSWWLPLPFNILVYTHSDDVIRLISHSYNDLPRLLMTITSLLLSYRQTCAAQSFFFFFSSNVQFLFCQYHTHIQARTRTKSRLTGIFDVFFSLFLYYTSVCTYRHVPLLSSVRHRGERTHLFPLPLSASFFFDISRSFSSLIEWLVSLNDDKWIYYASFKSRWSFLKGSMTRSRRKKRFASHSQMLASPIEFSSDALESNC